MQAASWRNGPLCECCELDAAVAGPAVWSGVVGHRVQLAVSHHDESRGCVTSPNQKCEQRLCSATRQVEVVLVAADVVCVTADLYLDLREQQKRHKHLVEQCLAGGGDHITIGLELDDLAFDELVEVGLEFDHQLLGRCGEFGGGCLVGQGAVEREVMLDRMSFAVSRALLHSSEESK